MQNFKLNPIASAWNPTSIHKDTLNGDVYYKQYSQNYTINHQSPDYEIEITSTIQCHEDIILHTPDIYYDNIYELSDSDKINFIKSNFMTIYTKLKKNYEFEKRLCNGFKDTPISNHEYITNIIQLIIISDSTYNDFMTIIHLMKKYIPLRYEHFKSKTFDTKFIVDSIVQYFVVLDDNTDIYNMIITEYKDDEKELEQEAYDYLDEIMEQDFERSCVPQEILQKFDFICNKAYYDAFPSLSNLKK